jgi:methylmalonyl-CoA mutase cobalamin-binding subunit
MNSLLNSPTTNNQLHQLLSTQHGQAMIGYLLCDDLMWMSRVMGAAKELGCKIIPARTLEQLKKAVATNGVHCVIIDLAQAEASPDPAAVVEAMKQMGLKRFVAYGSHIETSQLAAARQAGCQPTLTRSKMAAELAQLLPDWLVE